MKRFSELVLVLILAATAGCSREERKPTAAAAQLWSWSKYPRVERMRLATVPCRVLPKTSLNINAPYSGLLRIYVDRSSTNLQAGFVWAEFEPKILAAESNALYEARAKVDERERLLLELELPRQRIEISRKVEELTKQVTLMKLLATNPAVAPKIMPFAGIKEKSVRNEAIARSEEELRVAQQNYQYLVQTNLQVLGHDFQTQRSELDRRQLEFDRQQAAARLKMPFDGQLNPSLPLADGVTEYPVNAGQELSVVRDLSLVLLRVPLADPSWSALPTEQLAAVVTLPDGSRMEAPFAFKKLERVQLREDVVFYFQFPMERSPSAARLVGTEVSCELWLGLGQPAYVVPKLTLVLHQPSAFSSRRWNEGLAKLAPGASLLVEGQNDIAIVLPDEATTPSETKPNERHTANPAFARRR